MSELPSWFGGSKNKRKKINERSRKLEQRHAKATGGRPQAGSGSSWRAPADVKGGEFLDEHKFTEGESFSLKVSDWIKIRSHALVSGREPRMVIEFPERGIKLYVTEADD